MRGSVF